MRPSSFMWLCGTGLFAIFSSILTGVLFSFPAGLLSVRFGRKNLLRFSLVVFASAPFLYLLSVNTWQLGLVRFYHGLAIAVFTPIAMALVADIFQTQRGERLGWFSASTLIGRFMAPMVGGSVLGAAVLHPEMEFKVVYGICGAAGILALLAGFRIQPPAAVKYRKAHTLQDSFKVFQGIISNHGILWASLVEAAMGVFGSVMDIGHSTGPLAGGIISGYYGFGNCFLAASLALLVVAGLFFVRMKHCNQCH